MDKSWGKLKKILGFFENRANDFFDNRARSLAYQMVEIDYTQLKRIEDRRKCDLITQRSLEMMILI